MKGAAAQNGQRECVCLFSQDKHINATLTCVRSQRKQGSDEVSRWSQGEASLHLIDFNPLPSQPYSTSLTILFSFHHTPHLLPYSSFPTIPSYNTIPTIPSYNTIPTYSFSTVTSSPQSYPHAPTSNVFLVSQHHTQPNLHHHIPHPPPYPSPITIPPLPPYPSHRNVSEGALAHLHKIYYPRHIRSARVAFQETRIEAELTRTPVHGNGRVRQRIPVHVNGRL